MEGPLLSLKASCDPDTGQEKIKVSEGAYPTSNSEAGQALSSTWSNMEQCMTYPR